MARSPHSFLGYYKRFVTLFLREFLRARGKQLSAFALVTIGTIAITSSLGNIEWKKLYIVLAANGVAFGLMALWHFVRTPWLLSNERDQSLRARMESTALDLLRFLTRHPIPEQPPYRAPDTGQRLWQERWDHFWEVEKPLQQKINAGYSAHFAEQVSKLRHEIEESGTSTVELDILVDGNYHDSDRIAKLASKLLEMAGTRRIHELLETENLSKIAEPRKNE